MILLKKDKKKKIKLMTFFKIRKKIYMEKKNKYIIHFLIVVFIPLPLYLYYYKFFNLSTKKEVSKTSFKNLLLDVLTVLKYRDFFLN